MALKFGYALLQYIYLGGQSWPKHLQLTGEAKVSLGAILDH